MLSTTGYDWPLDRLARLRMLIAALMSAWSAKPHSRQANLSWVCRCSLAVCPTVRALPAAVAGIDRDQENTCQRSLLAQKGAKLMERPTAQSGRLLFPNRYPVVDALQLFQGDAALGALGLGNDLLQDAVIDVSSKASFFATELLELPFGAARDLLLQFRAQRTSAIANLVDLTSRQLLAIGGGGDGFDAEINPRKVLCHAWLRGRNIARRSNVEIVFVVDQVRLTMLLLQQFFLGLPGRTSSMDSSSSSSAIDLLI